MLVTQNKEINATHGNRTRLIQLQTWQSRLRDNLISSFSLVGGYFHHKPPQSKIVSDVSA